MEPCLLCNVNSVPRAGGEAPICERHRELTQAAFTQAELVLRTHLEQTFGAELDDWVREGRVPGLAWQLQVRDHPPEPTREMPYQRPGRSVHFSLEHGLRVLELLQPLTAAPATDPSPSGVLTGREREVAGLLAAGRSNREIAETLVISEGTVEVHVKHILGKMELRSRAQVAGWAANQPL
jgi:DNA-binding CsgD family transcriptional regulator